MTERATHNPIEAKTDRPPLVIVLSTDGLSVNTDIQRADAAAGPIASGSSPLALMQQLGDEISAYLAPDSKKSLSGKPAERFSLLCQALGENFLSPALKAELALLTDGAIFLALDARLRRIPWELSLYQGLPLCRRFSIGRIDGGFAPAATIKPRPYPLSVWWIKTHPTASTGVFPGLRAVTAGMAPPVHKGPLFQVAAASRQEITDARFREECGDYAIIHYDGGTVAEPEPSADIWRLADNLLNAADLPANGHAPGAPRLLLAASRHRLSAEWLKALAAAGLTHCLTLAPGGQISLINAFTERFYQSLAGGKTIGRSLLEAQEFVAGRSGSSMSAFPCFLWGDPNQVFGDHRQTPTKPADKPEIRLDPAHIPELSPLAEDESEAMFREMFAGAGVQKSSKIAYRGVGVLIGLVLALVVFSLGYVLFTPHSPQSPAPIQLPQNYPELASLKVQQLQPLLTKLNHRIWPIASGVQHEPEFAPLPRLAALAIDIESKRLNPLQDLDALAAAIMDYEFKLNPRISAQPRIFSENLLNTLEKGSAQSINQQQWKQLTELRLIAFIEIGGAGPRRGIFIHLADIESGAIIAATMAPLPNDAALIRVANQLMPPLTAAIHRLFPLQGTLFEIEDDQGRLNIGQHHGVRLGQRFKGGPPDAIFQVVGLEAQACVIKQVSGAAEPNSGMTLMLIDP